jgi:DNA-directed RNA polymerase
MGIDTGSLSVFTIGEGEDARLFVKNSEVAFKGKTVSRLQRSDEEVRRRSIAPEGNILGSDLSSVYTEAVNYLSAGKFKPNGLILSTMRTLASEGHFDLKKNMMELLMLQEFSEFGIGEYFLPMFPDFRFRIYTDSQGIASYQGGDAHRAVCDFAERLPASDDDIQIFLEVIGEEYGVTEDNYRSILADPVKFVREFKGSKPFCTLRAAEAIREMKEDGVSGYILQQDQTASGPALFGWFTGDEGLCRFTNFYPSVSKQCLYRATAKLVEMADLLPMQVRNNPLFVERKTAKTFIMPMVYSAANPSLTRGAILKDGNKKIKFLDDIGNYLPGSLEAVSLDDLNGRFSDVWKDMGWSLAVRVASDVARAYENALFGSKTVGGLTTRLRPAMVSLKRASRSVRLSGGVLNWTSPSGCKVFNRQMSVDLEADPVLINLRGGDGKRHRISFQPIAVGSSDAAAPPNVIHSVDGSIVHFIAVMAKEAGYRLAPIHDSFGTHICGARWIRAAFKEVMIYRINRQWINTDVLIPSKIDPLPYKGADVDRFMAAQHFLG